MYPKNAASPEPIAIGAVVQISDGAVQTSDCTVRIKPIGVAEGDGGGTTAYSTDGIVYYTPTQAETNYTSFILIAKKTSCIPVSITVITTSSVTPGTVLLAPVTHTSAVVPTVTTLTGHTAQTGDSFARIGATGSGLTSLAPSVSALSTSVWTGTLATNLGTTNSTVATNLDATISSRMATYTQPTGFLAATFPGTVASTTNITAATGITVATIGANVITASALATDAVDEIVDAVWDEVLTAATHNVATSAGKRLRQINAFQQTDGTVNDAGATTTSFVTDLASSVDNFYNDSMLVFTDGALAGQVRAITDYVGATKTITLEEALTSAPANGVAFTIVSIHIHPVSQIQTAVLTTQMTESYAADGVAPTLAQAIFLIQQAITEFAITVNTGAGTSTTTIKKIDGSTSAATLTLNSETAPTSATRAT